MHSITAKILRDAVWKEVYAYSSPTMSFRTFSSGGVPGVTVTHDAPARKGAKAKVTYSVFGKRTDSPTQAVRYFNEAQKAKRGERHPAGSYQSIKERRKGIGV